MSQLTTGSRFGVSALSAGVLVALLGLTLGPTERTQAALLEGGNGPQLLIGFDDDNQANALIQAARPRISRSTARTSSTAAGPMTSCSD